MSLSSPWFILLIIPLITIFYYALRRPGPTLPVATVTSFIALEKKDFRKGVSLITFFSAGLFIVFALAGPRYGTEHIMHSADGIDIIVALDVSGSMLAYDNPVEGQPLLNRLEVAKFELKEFVKRRPNDRIGLVIFGTLPYVASPPTLDHGWMLKTLDSVKINSAGGNTGIAGPIASAVRRLKELDGERKVIVLFTDGVNNVDVRITPVQAAELAHKFNITIYTVGIGGGDAYVLRPELGQSHLQKIDIPVDKKLLRTIAELTSGAFFEAGDATSMKNVLRAIDTMETTVREQPRYTEYKEYGPSLAIFAFLLLLFSLVWKNSIGLIIP